MPESPDSFDTNADRPQTTGGFSTQIRTKWYLAGSALEAPLFFTIQGVMFSNVIVRGEEEPAWSNSWLQRQGSGVPVAYIICF
jgi:hypothetical protein